MSSTKLSFRGSQQNLYSIAHLAWRYCLEYIAIITLAKGLYTPTYIESRLVRLEAAEDLPDYGNRKDIPKQPYSKLTEARNILLDKWQILKQYITDAFGPDVVASKLYAAGQVHYGAAERGNMDKVASLIRDAVKFMGANSVELLANNNMPVGFPADFQELADNFTNLRNSYFGKEDEMDGLTSDKQKANQAVVADLMPMLKFCARLFKADPEIKSKFIYTKLLDRVRSHQAAGLQGKFTTAGTQHGLAGVTLRALNTDYSTTSDQNGRFLLHMASGVYDLEISAPGYQTVFINNRKIDVGVKHRLKLALEPVAEPVVLLTPSMLEGIVAQPANGVPADAAAK